MYRYQYNLFKNEAIYIAGPECFYEHGFDMLNAMRRRAESLGFGVTLPNDNGLDMENDDLRKRANSIFADLESDINNSTVIISDLEAYRGAEADSGTIYEIGMAYARGIRSYGYTRDKRCLASKNQQSFLKNGIVYDEKGNVMPYLDLPFSPTIIGSTKIVEGDFDDCLHTLMVDIEEEYKHKADRGIFVDQTERIIEEKRDCPFVYLSGPERYDTDAIEKYTRMKQMCSLHGIAAITPIDPAPGVMIIEKDNPYTWAANLLDNYQRHVRRCDVIIADLNDFRGNEVCNDVGFECGMGFQLGKKLYGYLDNTDILINRIPNLGGKNDFRDHTGNNVENFNYPVNLMFACSMTIFEGDFEKIIINVAEDLKRTASVKPIKEIENEHTT